MREGFFSRRSNLTTTASSDRIKIASPKKSGQALVPPRNEDSFYCNLLNYRKVEVREQIATRPSDESGKNYTDAKVCQYNKLLNIFRVSDIRLQKGACLYRF